MKREINAKARGLSISLEKLGRKTGKGLWKRLAYSVARPVRKKAEVNLYELSEAAGKNAGKTLVVAGKVLATGEATGKMEVACISCSAAAKQKIINAGGKVMGIGELLSTSPDAGKVVIIE